MSPRCGSLPHPFFHFLLLRHGFVLRFRSLQRGKRKKDLQVPEAATLFCLTNRMVKRFLLCSDRSSNEKQFKSRDHPSIGEPHLLLHCSGRGILFVPAESRSRTECRTFSAFLPCGEYGGSAANRSRAVPGLFLSYQYYITFLKYFKLVSAKSFPFSAFFSFFLLKNAVLLLFT